MSSNQDERAAFSSRLIEAFAAVGMKNVSPTALARDFNLRSARPVTVHAARKWLFGEAIPSQQKPLILAIWLRVSPEWLRYGQSSQPLLLADAYAKIPKRAVRVLQEFGELTGRNKSIVEGLHDILKKYEKSSPELRPV